MKIIYPFASRSRPEKFIAGVENIYINSRNKDFTILASLDTDDITMNNEAMIEKMKLYDKLYPIWGVSENKIHAINRTMGQAPEQWDLLCNMSDDMFFIENGYDEIIEEEMNKYFPKKDGILHFPDGNRNDICTLSIMGKKYYETKGYIYYSGYKTWYADEEFTLMAKKENKYKFIDKLIFRHNHYQWGRNKIDALYQKNDNLAMIEMDKKLFEERKLLCGF